MEWSFYDKQSTVTIPIICDKSTRKSFPESANFHKKNKNLNLLKKDFHHQISIPHRLSSIFQKEIFCKINRNDIYFRLIAFCLSSCLLLPLKKVLLPFLYSTFLAQTKKKVQNVIYFKSFWMKQKEGRKALKKSLGRTRESVKRFSSHLKVKFNRTN